MKINNYKIVVSYDGTDYFGWQRQPRKPTIQAAIEDAVARIARKRVSIIASGRTDAGVHARGQVANFKAAVRIGEAEFLKALNALLPGDIRIISLEKAASEFHARRDARAKVYQYRIWNSPDISPFAFRFALHWPCPLHLGRMRKAARLFERTDDFSGFSSNRLLNPVRTVFRSELRKKGKEIIYTIEANGFLRYMVRAIAGALLEVGRGRIRPEAIEDIFRAKKRTLVSPTAPAKGLCLVEVIYDPGPPQRR
jgi:tRNA pseudouridine38-40 synthase